jgi:F-type H+-transporting ATPase subunit delta
MKGSRSAVRYAKAVFSLANESDMSSKVYDDMLFYINFCSIDKSFSDMLANSVINTKSKHDIILSLNNNVSDLSKNLISLLISNKRISILVEVCNAYKSLYEAANNMIKAVVVTSVPITESINQKALLKINSISSKKVEINNIIDKNILGGFILRYDGKEYNASLSNKLQKIKKELI